MLRYLTLLLFTLFMSTSFSQEICNNGIDDDGDMLIDLNDSECSCNSAVVGNPTSIIPNPSFEDMNCCPVTFSQLNCANTWVQASDATSDYMNICDYVGPYDVAPYFPFPDGDGMVGFLPQEGYKEYVGACLLSPLIAGTSYTLQMEVAAAGIQFDAMGELMDCFYNAPTSTLDLVIFGNPNCGNLPILGMDCPLPSGIGYIQIGSESMSLLTTNWQTLTFTFTPTVTINEIIIGPPCSLPVGWIDGLSWDIFAQCSPYFLVDNLILNTSASFSSMSVNQQGSLCANDLVLSTTVGDPGGVYQWFEEGIAIVGQTNNTLNVSTLGLGAGTFQATYNLNGDCYLDSIVVSSLAGGILNVNNAEICPGDTAELIVSGGTDYAWSPSTGLSSSTGAIVNASPSQTTSYTVSSTDANGCVSEAISIVTVVSPVSNIEIVISPIPVETEATLLATPISVSYTWTDPDGLILTQNPISYQFPEGEGNFTFTVQAEDEFGCIRTENVTISITSDLIVYVPNSFSPDFDEFNSTFNPVLSENIDSQEYSLLIFNRWGELIFESNDPSIGWDGTYDGRLVQSGTYTWTLKIKAKNKDDRKRFNGTVNVLR